MRWGSPTVCNRSGEQGPGSTFGAVLTGFALLGSLLVLGLGVQLSGD